jgi:phosphoribosylanthranilate isomerase
MRIKVCGNTAVETALVAVEAGADALGFIMAPGSPRTLAPAQARAITRRLPPTVDCVGVFVDATAAEVREVAIEAGFTAVQLHGQERWEDFSDLDLPVIKAVRLSSAADAARVDWPAGSLLLVDAHRPGMAGGTGRTFPWEWASDLMLRYRVILSGGLSAANVGAAVGLDPWGVDASSRLESSPGVKDPDRVRAFVQAARAAEVLVHA